MVPSFHGKYGETVETVTDFIFLGSKITADGDCSHEIKRCLILGRKAMTNLHSILKSRDITLPTKVHLVIAIVFPVVMYGCESWTTKKAEHQRIDAFQLWCWRILLRVLLTARKSNQSILKRSVLGVNWKDWCWSWNSNTLVTWCEELTHLKRPWCWERLKAGGDKDDRWRDGWMASLTQWRWVWVNPELVMDWEAWRNAVHGVTKSRTRLSDWTQLTDKLGVLYLPYYTITNSGLVITPISQIGKLRFHNLFFVTQLSSEISGFRSCFIWL